MTKTEHNLKPNRDFHANFESNNESQLTWNETKKSHKTEAVNSMFTNLILRSVGTLYIKAPVIRLRFQSSKLFKKCFKWRTIFQALKSHKILYTIRNKQSEDTQLR